MVGESDSAKRTLWLIPSTFQVHKLKQVDAVESRRLLKLVPFYCVSMSSWRIPLCKRMKTMNFLCEKDENRKTKIGEHKRYTIITAPSRLCIMYTCYTYMYYMFWRLVSVGCIRNGFYFDKSYVPTAQRAKGFGREVSNLRWWRWPGGYCWTANHNNVI